MDIRTILASMATLVWAVYLVVTTTRFPNIEKPTTRAVLIALIFFFVGTSLLWGMTAVMSKRSFFDGLIEPYALFLKLSSVLAKGR